MQSLPTSLETSAVKQTYYLDKRDIKKANEMVRRLKTTKGLKNYTLEYKTFVHEYK